MLSLALRQRTKSIQLRWHHVEADPELVFVQVLALVVAKEVHDDVVVEVTMHDRRNSILVTFLRAENVIGEL